MIEVVLPSACAWADELGALRGPHLPSDDERVVAGAAPARRREFAAGRSCARAALTRLGVPEPRVGVGADGAPTWPPGVVGSITHCADYVAAAVADRSALRGLGIDAEPHRRLSDAVLDRVASPTERSHLAELAARDPSVGWGCVLFSAKESAFKCWWPLTRTWMDFSDGQAFLDPASGQFEVTLHRAVPVAGEAAAGTVRGLWAVRAGLVLTAAWVPA